ncbi:serine racemase VanT catalytic subunit [Lachnospiraceae bacterium]|nr:serine racemase VanT catalytic subunit [Lachnospiraceae bacterium]
MYGKGRAWIELNLKNLKHNIEEFRRLLPCDCELMPAVKANAYGHGAVPVAKALQEQGVHAFCVASAAEGAQLRRAGISGELLVLGYTHPAEFDELIACDLIQTVIDGNYAEELQRDGRRFTVHVGIDTGMHRIGERWENIEEIIKIFQMPHLKVTGIFSHLCVSDGQSGEERAYTLEQIRHFEYVAEELHRQGFSNFKCHLQGSYGILNYSQYCFDYARAGIAFYGIYSGKHDSTKARLDLVPVLSLKARVISVRTLYKGEGAGYGLTYHPQQNRKIAVLSIGYADGIPRNLSNCGYVLCQGRMAPIVGRICMDQMLVDVTEIPQISPGEEAVLIGKSGSLEIRAEDVAQWAGTISNEIVSRLGERLERIAE